MFKLNARAIKSIIVIMGVTFLSGCNNEVMNCLANTQATNCLELAVKDTSFSATPSNKIDQGGAPASSGKIDQGGAPTYGGKIDQGGAPAYGGKIDQGGAPAYGGKIVTQNSSSTRYQSNYSSGSNQTSIQLY